MPKDHQQQKGIRTGKEGHLAEARGTVQTIPEEFH
jgi:hypothetical protein